VEGPRVRRQVVRSLVAPDSNVPPISFPGPSASLAVSSPCPVPFPVVSISPLSAFPPAVVRPFVPGKYLFPPDGFPPLYPVSGWVGVPCPGRVPIYSVYGSPFCDFSPVGSSLTFLDSGPTFNLTGDWSLSHGPVTPVDIPVTGVDSVSRLGVTRFGVISVVLGGQPITLRDSFFVPDLTDTLISVRGLVCSQGVSCTFTPEGDRLDLSELSVPVWAPSSEELYTLDTFTPSPLPLLTYTSTYRSHQFW
jgi:hypothetical protein